MKTISESIGLFTFIYKTDIFIWIKYTILYINKQDFKNHLFTKIASVSIARLLK